MSAYCQNCGTAFNASAKYCSNCGREVTAGDSEEKGAQPVQQHQEQAGEVERPSATTSESTPPSGQEKPNLYDSARNRYLAVFTLGLWLIVPYTAYLWRRGSRAAAVALGTVTLLVLVIAISALGSGGSSTTSRGPIASVSTTPARVTDAKGNSCLKSRIDFAHRCPANSNYGKTKGQVRAEAIKEAKAAKRAKLAAAREAKARRARLARAAAAERARVVTANAWHRGYIQQDENIYWRWVDGQSCRDYVQNGCWHVAVIARDGCASYVAVQANEYSGKSIINSMLDNQGYGIPAKTSRVFELDADQDGVTAGDLSVECQ